MPITYTEAQKKEYAKIKDYHFISILGAMVCFKLKQTHVAEALGMSTAQVKKAMSNTNNCSVAYMRNIDNKLLAYIDENFKGDSRYKLHKIIHNTLEENEEC